MLTARGAGSILKKPNNMNLKLKWTFYSITLAFSTYWFVNLLLWYPWSYSAILGMILMFVAITPIWTYSVYNCMIRIPGEKLIIKAIYTSLVFTLVTIFLDFIFYGIMRGAMTELYHPTTLYGYGFLLSLPFIEILLFRERLIHYIDLKFKNFMIIGLWGLLSLSCITGIIMFDIKLTESNFKFITMIFASLIIFNLVIWIILRTKNYITNFKQIVLLSVICVVIGMIIGKYGADFGLKWWIYYPIPVMINLLLPPLILKLNNRQILSYLSLSIIAAPLIHVIFSFFFNWTEYMPFVKIPYFEALISK